MPLSSSQIPNLPLAGPELKMYCSSILQNELELRSVPESILADVVDALCAAMSNDFLFLAGTSYPNVRVELEVRLHYRDGECEYSLRPVIHTANPLDKVHPVFVRVSTPLSNRDNVKTEAFTLMAAVDNPNLVRVHYGLPIVLTRRKDPDPGQIFSEVVSEALEYNPADFDEPTPPSVKDETEEVAEAYNRKPSTPPLLKASTPPAKRGWNKAKRG